MVVTTRCSFDGQALKIFRDLGHLKGELTGLQRLAQVDQQRKCFDDAGFKASEALRSARHLGDRLRELQLCELLVEVHIAQDRAEQALQAAKEAELVAKTLENRKQLAKAKCLIARAYGAYQELEIGGKTMKTRAKRAKNLWISALESLPRRLSEERMMTGIKEAEEGMQMYQQLSDQPGEVEALEALASATKEDFEAVFKSSKTLAEKCSETGYKEAKDTSSTSIP